MIGAVSTDFLDVTPRLNGKVVGSPWAEVTHSDPVAWANVGPLLPTPTVGTMRVSWEVRGRLTGGDPLLSVGQARVIELGGNSLIVETVETFHDDRIRFSTDGTGTVMQAQSHLTEDWEFQVRIAYDTVSE